MTDHPTIQILRAKPHGISNEEYERALREQLPDLPIKRAATPQAERNSIVETSIATGISIDQDLVERAENLKLFACGAAGVDHLPLETLRDEGVVVTNAGGVHGPSIAEHVLGSILTFARGLHRCWQQQERREWRHFQAFGELQGSTVTVVGLGSIGQAVTERLEGFNVETIGVRYTPKKGGPTDEVIGYDPEKFHRALSRTDYLVLACPLTEVTRGLIGEEELLTLPANAVVVNIARGPVLETDALVASLRNFSQIRGAALDVTDPEPLPEDHPLWRLNNVLITPHLAGYTPDYWERVADILAENVERIRLSGEYDDLVNQVY
jgi:phosphoglycerate dehydrogenase-like enzyme